MKRIVVDTNVLVSFLTDRDREQQERAAELLDRAATRQVEVALPQIVATELVYVLTNRYRLQAEEVAGLLSELLATPGIQPIVGLPWSIVFDLWPKRIGGFADAVVAAISAHGKHDAVATFDRRFGRELARLDQAVYWPV